MKQRTAAIRRDAQIKTLTKMVSVLAEDLVRISLRCKVVEDVLAKKCGITKKDFQASTDAICQAIKKQDELGDGESATQADQDLVPEAALPLDTALAGRCLMTSEALPVDPLIQGLPHDIGLRSPPVERRPPKNLVLFTREMEEFLDGIGCHPDIRPSR